MASRFGIRVEITRAGDAHFGIALVQFDYRDLGCDPTDDAIECTVGLAAPKNRDPLAAFASGVADSDPNAEQARRELAAYIPEGLNVDLGSCFPETSGRAAVRLNKARMSYLVNAATLLRACLAGDEIIKYLCLAREKVWWEMLGAGHWAMLLNKNLLVITDRRVLLVHCDGKGRPNCFVNQIPLGAIRRAKGFLASCSLILNGGARSFRVTYADRKIIKEMFAQENTAASGSAEHLCPACFAPSAKHVEQCASCATRFKSPRTAAIRSLLVPGLGAWYGGSKGLATLLMIRGAFLWLLVFGLAAGAFATEDGAQFAILAMVFFGVLLFEHGIGALLSRALTKKGLIALDLSLPAPKAS